MAKAAFKKKKGSRKKTLFTSKLDSDLRERKLVQNYNWSTVLYGVETWTLWKVCHKHLEDFKRGAVEEWRRSVGSIV
jgi:hypothetical protein